MELPLYIEKETFKFDFKQYEQKFNWVQDMFKTEQDSLHHAEGNVGIHTEMVMNAMINLPEFKNLSNQEKEILFLGSLFHDIEKRSTTKNENGRIISPGHAKKGEITTRGILYRDFECEFYMREQICKIVRHHGLPLWIFEKQNSEKAIIESSLLSNNNWLALIAKADVIGRICEDKEELFYKIDLFREYAKELGVLNTPKTFNDPHSKQIYFEKEESYLDYTAYDNTKFEIVIMSGLPGSGKDYFIENNFNIPVVSLDNLRREHKIQPGDKYGTGFIIQMAKEKAKEFLRKKEPFVWNGTNITKQIREQVIGLMRSYNARVKLIYVEVSYQKLIQQNLNRPYPISRIILEKFIDKLEIPSPTEAHIVEHYSNYKKI